MTNGYASEDVDEFINTFESGEEVEAWVRDPRTGRTRWVPDYSGSRYPASSRYPSRYPLRPPLDSRSPAASRYPAPTRYPAPSRYPGLSPSMQGDAATVATNAILLSAVASLIRDFTVKTATLQKVSTPEGNRDVVVTEADTSTLARVLPYASAAYVLFANPRGFLNLSNASSAAFSLGGILQGILGAFVVQLLLKPQASTSP